MADDPGLAETPDDEFAGIAEQARRADSVRRAIESEMRLAEQAAAGLQSLASSYQNLTRQLATSAAASAAQALARQQEKIEAAIAGAIDSWNRALPNNWPAERWHDVFELVRETRWPLVWAPREIIVVDLLKQSDQAHRDQVLVDHVSEVVDDCDAVLSEITSSDYTELVPFALEAGASLRDGRAAAAQALAAGIATTIIQHHLGYDRLAEAAKELAVDPEDVPFDVMRIALITSCVPDTLSSFWPGDPVPTSFNRHASVHRVSTEQYTDRNAIVSLLLVSALLRELDELETSGRWKP